MLGKLFCWFRVGETTPDKRLEELAVVIDRSVGEWTKAVQELMAQHERLHDSAPPASMRRVK